MRSRSWLDWTNTLPAALVVAGLAWVSASCADFHRGPAPADGGGDTGPVNDPTFEAQVYPVLLMRCGVCHAEGQEAGLSKLVLTGDARLDRAMVVALVTPGQPTRSELLIEGSGVDSHMGGIRLPVDSADYAKLADWIAMLPPAP